MLLRNLTLQRLFGGTFFEWLWVDIVARMEMMRLAMHKDWAKLKVLRLARRQLRSLVTNQEMFILHSIAGGMVNVPGEYAEVVCGGTFSRACRIASMKPLSDLYETGTPIRCEKCNAVAHGDKIETNHNEAGEQGSSTFFLHCPECGYKFTDTVITGPGTGPISYSR